MRKIINTLLLSALLLMVGCYSDKGNYDYKKLPTPIISNIDNSYEVFVGDALKITPNIEYKDGASNIKNPKYKWIIDTKVVSEEKDLNYVVSLTPGKRCYATYTIIDGDTNVETAHKFYVTASSAFQQGWLILGEKNGKGLLSYQRPDGLFYEDIYNSINGEELSSEPVKLREHWIPWSSEIAQVCVICKGAPNYSVELDGSSFQKVIYNKQEFVGGEAPAGFAPVDAHYVSSYDMLFNADGKVYVRGIDATTDAKYQTGVFPTFPFYGDYELSGWTARGDYVYGNDVISYDKKNRRYVLVANGQVSSFNTTGDTNNAFPVINMKKDVIAGGCIAYANTPREDYVTILKGDDGKYYVQRFGMTGWRPPKAFRSVSEIVFPIDGFITPDTKFAFSIGRPYIYMSKGSELWEYNYDSNQSPILIKDYGKKITAMAFDLSATTLGIGTEGGDFLVVDVSIVGGGNILSRQTGVCGDKVVDLIWKVGDLWSF